MADEKIMQKIDNRGRKSVIPQEQFVRMIEIHRSYFVELGKMPPLNDLIIEEFAKTFNATKKGISLKIKKYLSSIETFKKSESVEDQIEEQHFLKVLVNDENIHEITLSEKDRIKLLPTYSESTKRLQMPINWTFFLSIILWDNGIRTECAYVFINRNVVDAELKVSAKCSECLASFCIRSEQNFTKLILNWTNVGLKDIIHVKKRQIRSNVRSEIGKELANKTSTVYRREIASSSMVPEDVTPAFIARTGIKFDLNIYLILKPFFYSNISKNCISVCKRKFIGQQRCSIYTVGM